MQRARKWIAVAAAGVSLGVVLSGCSSSSTTSGSNDKGKNGGNAQPATKGPETPGFASDLERVCTDQLGFPGMPAYDRTKKTVHPAMLLTKEGGTKWTQSAPTTGDYPTGWLVGYTDKPAKAELVVCVDRTKSTPTGKVCRMKEDSGKQFDVKTYDTGYRLRVLDARTGKELYKHTGETKSGDCPSLIYTSSGEDKTKYYNDVQPGDYRGLLKPYIAP